ncbi:MAG: Short-chain dehydrogenase, partial [Blastococcus sp.]|nr:Short-chain dehydrogenase [Blastococcus sp.]
FAGSLTSKAMGKMAAMTPDTIAAKAFRPPAEPGSAND